MWQTSACAVCSAATAAAAMPPLRLRAGVRATAALRASALLLLTIVCLSTTTMMRLTEAAAWRRGDVFLGVNPAQIEVVDGTTFASKEIINVFPDCSNFITNGAFNPEATKLFFACFSDGKVVVINATGSGSHDIITTFVSGGLDPSSIVFDRDGNLLVGHELGPAPTVFKFHPANYQQLAAFTVANEGAFIDLAYPGRKNTLVYSWLSTTLLSYDLGTRTQLPDFTPSSIPGCSASLTIRVLPDNSVLVVCTTCVFYLTAAGAVQGQFCPASLVNIFYSLAVTPDLKHFIVADNGPNAPIFVVPFAPSTNGSIVTFTSVANFTTTVSGGEVFGVVVLGSPPCVSGGCCNATSGELQPAGFVCGATQNPCVARQCSGSSHVCPAAATPLPNQTPCLPDGDKRRGKDGKVVKCPHKHYGSTSLSVCTGSCQGGACIVARASNAKCCKLPLPAAKKKQCFCWKR